MRLIKIGDHRREPRGDRGAAKAHPITAAVVVLILTKILAVITHHRVIRIVHHCRVSHAWVSAQLMVHRRIGRRSDEPEAQRDEMKNTHNLYYRARASETPSP